MNPLYQKILWLFSLPVYFIIIPFEILLSNFRHKPFYSWKETFVNIYLNLLNSGVDLALRFFIGFTVLFFFYSYRINISWNPIAYWTILVLGEDLLFWCEHYIDHMVRLF